MFKNLVVLVGAALLLPVWAQSQGQSGAKAQAHRSSAQAKARADADLTARLQARAIAEAAAQAAVLAKASTSPSVQLPADAAPVNGVPAHVSAPQPTQAQAPVPIQALPAWTELPPKGSDATAAPTLAAVPTSTTAPALAVLPPLSPVAAGLAVATPMGQNAPNPVSQELAIAQQIHQGLMPCEMGASVRVEPMRRQPGLLSCAGQRLPLPHVPRAHQHRCTASGGQKSRCRMAATGQQVHVDGPEKRPTRGRRMCAPRTSGLCQDMKTNPPPSLFDKPAWAIQRLTLTDRRKNHVESLP
jgi:hypothetical protein